MLFQPGDSMGRTIPSYRMVLEREIAEWKRFGVALRQEDQKLFEEILNTCRLYASASGAATRPIVAEAMFMAILLHHQKMLNQLKEELEWFSSQNNRAAAKSSPPI